MSGIANMISIVKVSTCISSILVSFPAIFGLEKSRFPWIFRNCQRGIANHLEKKTPRESEVLLLPTTEDVTTATISSCKICSLKVTLWTHVFQVFTANVPRTWCKHFHLARIAIDRSVLNVKLTDGNPWSELVTPTAVQSKILSGVWRVCTTATRLRTTLARHSLCYVCSAVCMKRRMLV